MTPNSGTASKELRPPAELEDSLDYYFTHVAWQGTVDIEKIHQVN